MLECETTQKKTKPSQVSVTNDQDIGINVETMKVDKCTRPESSSVFKNVANSLLKSHQDKNFIRLLHARTCQAEDETWGCALLFCKSTKKILNHIQTCIKSSDCSIPECDESKKILAHWDQCRMSNCRTCLPARLAIKKKLVNHSEEQQQNIKEYFLLLYNELQSLSEERRAKGDIHQRKLPTCEKIKKTLGHFLDCKNITFCTIHNCGLTRQILSHWRDCVTPSSCHFCLLIHNQQTVNLAVHAFTGSLECNSNTTTDVETIKVDDLESQKSSTIDNTVVVNSQEDQMMASIIEALSPTLEPVLPHSKVLSGNQSNFLPNFQTQEGNKEELIKELYLYQSYLENLLHARICQAKNKTWRCALLLCENTKVMVNHVRSCTNNSKCSAVLCTSTKKVLGHWNQCRVRNCHICVDVKKVINRNKGVQPPGVITEENLIHLFHAHACWEKDRESSGQIQKCIQPYCNAIRSTLDHLSTCNKRIFCPFLNCDLIRRIFVHWNSCVTLDCPACLPIKLQRINNNTTDSFADNDHAKNNDLNTIFGSENFPVTKNASNIIPLNIPLDEAERRRLIQQQLIILLHAQKCRMRENGPNSKTYRCTLPHCKTMKNVLNHMETCKDSKKCTVTHCNSSRQIILHWKHCQKSDCPVCIPIRKVGINKPPVDPTAATINNNTVNRQPNPSPPDMKNNNDDSFPLNSDSAKVATTDNEAISNPISDTATSIVADISPLDSMNQLLKMDESEQPMSFDESRLSSLQLPDHLKPVKITASLVQETKEWHKSITSDRRTHLVHKLVYAIFPTANPLAIFDQRLHNLIAYARKVEGDMYEIANSRAEYYHLLAEKIYKIQKELEEKRQNRKELQLAQQQESRIQSAAKSSMTLDVTSTVEPPKQISSNLKSYSPGTSQSQTQSQSVQSEANPGVNVETIEKNDIKSSKYFTVTNNTINSQAVYVNLFQTHVLRLLHAHECQNKDETWQCELLFCRNMKQLLNHMRICKNDTECKTLYCNESKWVWKRWTQCERIDCSACLPIKNALKNKDSLKESNELEELTQEQLIYWLNVLKPFSQDDQTLALHFLLVLGVKPVKD